MPGATKAFPALFAATLLSAGISQSAASAGPEADQATKTDSAQQPGDDDQPAGTTKGKETRSGLGWAGLPLLNFSTDSGVGYGARLALYDYGQNQKPYRYSLTAQFFQTTRGEMNHRLIFDAPRFRGSRWRIDGEIQLHGDRFTPWYGLGGTVEYEEDVNTCDDRDALAIDPDVCPGNPDFRGLRYYNYETLEPWVGVNLRRGISGPWQVMAGYLFRLVFINTRYPDDLGQTGPSRLVEDLMAGEPIVGLDGLELDGEGGVDTTRIGEVQTGLIYDTRDIESAPTRGIFGEASVRAGSPIAGGSFWYWGFNFNLRGYRHIDAARRLVLAGRVVFDVAGGDMPFHEMAHTGGLSRIEGLGGLGSLRGLLRVRYSGKVKALLSTELRWSFVTLRPRGRKVEFTAVTAVDTGRVWRDFGSDGPFFDWPISSVGGLRIAYNDNFVIRGDYGYSFSDQTSTVYIDFGHSF